MFLDDGLGGNSRKESASTDAIAVRADLAKLGFLLSVDKCVWEPSLIQTWLGYVLSMSGYSQTLRRSHGSHNIYAQSNWFRCVFVH